MEIRDFQGYVWFATCVGVIFADTQTVPARVGSTAVLPCHLSDVSSQPLHIIWRIKHEVVFERKGKASYVGEGYEGRVDVPEEELRNGNCSLLLNHVRSTDAGVYQSYLGMKRTKRAPTGKLHLIQSIELSVNAEERTDKTPDSSDGTEVSPDSSDNGVKNLHYLWFLIILPAVVLLGLGVWLLMRKKSAYSRTENTEEPKEMN